MGQVRDGGQPVTRWVRAEMVVDWSPDESGRNVPIFWLKFFLKHIMNVSFSFFISEIYCRPNHKPRKSIMVEFKLFTHWNCCIIIFQNLEAKLPLLSKIERRKSLLIQKIMKKQLKKDTWSHLRGLQLLYDRNLQRKTNQKARKVAHFHLTNYDVINAYWTYAAFGTFCRTESWKWTYVVFDLFSEEKNMKYCFFFVFFFFGVILQQKKSNWKNISESIFSKAEYYHINTKPRKTKFKLAQVYSNSFNEFIQLTNLFSQKMSNEFVNLFLSNYECKHWDYFSRFLSKTTFWTNVVYDFYGSIIYAYMRVMLEI